MPNISDISAYKLIVDDKLYAVDVYFSQKCMSGISIFRTYEIITDNVRRYALHVPQH